MGKREIKIVHLSDLHIRSEPDKINFRSGPDEAGLKVEQLVSDINIHHPDSIVAVTGDITDSGTEQSIKLAKKLLKPIRRPHRLYVVPGNHDCGTWGWNYNHDYERKADFRSMLDVMHENEFPWYKERGHIVLIGIDSTSRETKWARGKIGVTQMGTLPTLIERAIKSDKIPVIMLHHDPLQDNSNELLEDASGFRKLLEERYKSVRIFVLCGHGHKRNHTCIYKKHREGEVLVRYLISPSSASTRPLEYGVIRIGPQGEFNYEVETVPYLR